jgi:uncharacterized phosphosugar-binding protein
MLRNTYLRAVAELCERLDGQAPAVEAAADLIVTALTNGGAVFTAEVGHGNQHDWLNRAGGLAALRAFSWSFTLTDSPPEARRNRPHPAGEEEAAPDLANVRHAVRVSQLRPDDVLLLGSVSGRNRVPVELALACRERGVRTVGFTSLEYTRKVASLHPSGKRLFEAVDVAVDVGAPYGDAACRLPGYDVPLLPVSGVGAIAAGWMVLGRVMEKLAARGTPASVYLSVNREGGEAFYKEQRARCEQQGF